MCCCYSIRCRFQSTLPARGATKDGVAYSTPIFISIHAPRTGSDDSPRTESRAALFQSTLPARGATTIATALRNAVAFQSTLPARGATTIATALRNAVAFQSTLPARGATAVFTAHTREGYIISIHAPRTGSDGRISSERCVEHDFNPRSPHGERRSLGSFIFTPP